MMTVSSASGFTAGPTHASLRYSAIARTWPWIVARGLLALVLGGVCIAYPIGALFAFTMVFAAYAAVDGIVSLVAGLTSATQRDHRWGAMILRGVLGIAIGALFVVAPGAMAVGYAFFTLALLAGWAMLGGALELAAADHIRRAGGNGWTLGLAGALSLLLGGVVLWLLIVNPAASFVSVAWVIGAYAWLAGFALIGFGLRLRRLADR